MKICRERKVQRFVELTHQEALEKVPSSLRRTRTDTFAAKLVIKTQISAGQSFIYPADTFPHPRTTQNPVAARTPSWVKSSVSPAGFCGCERTATSTSSSVTRSVMPRKCLCTPAAPGLFPGLFPVPM